MTKLPHSKKKKKKATINCFFFLVREECLIKIVIKGIIILIATFNRWQWLMDLNVKDSTMTFDHLQNDRCRYM